MTDPQCSLFWMLGLYQWDEGGGIEYLSYCGALNINNRNDDKELYVGSKNYNLIKMDIILENK